MKKLLSLLLLTQLVFFYPDTLLAKDVTLISLSLPDLHWSLDINLPGFELKQKEVSPSGEAARFHAENPSTGLIVSAFLEKAPKNGDSKDCRSYYWEKAQRSPTRKKKIKEYEINNLAFVDYIIPEYQGMKVNQKNINAYLAEDNFWIDIHLSKVNFQTGDEKLFRTIIETISIDRNYIASAYDNFYYGSIFYQQNQYEKATPFFEKALEQEKQRPTLGKNLFKVLVDLLGMSYGISGNLIKAKETFQWAITIEPEFPMFYYNLACVYAESDEMNKSIENLRKAYQYKENMLEGEKLPDPSSDSSFSKYMTNQVFISELNKMKK